MTGTEEVSGEKRKQVCAARAAMRVWPAFAGVDRNEMSHVDLREVLLVAMRLPWKKCFDLEIQEEEQSLNGFLVELGAAATTASADAANSATAYAAHAAHAAANAAANAAAALAAAAYNASDDAAAHAAHAARVRGVGADAEAALAADALAHAASFAASRSDARTNPLRETESLLLRPLWLPFGQKDSEPFHQSLYWRPVRETWERLMRNLDLENWIDYYDQACERGFTVEEARAWFLDDPVPAQFVKLPFASDPTQLAEYLFYSSIDSRTAWETAGVLTEECFVKTFESLREQSESPERQLERIKERHSAKPDPLWLSWFVESQWEEILPVVESAWKKVHSMSDVA